MTELDPALVTLGLEGTRRYREAYELVYRREATKPNEIWQADHTELDIWVLDERGTPVRPWLTAVGDDHSHAIAGYAVNSWGGACQSGGVKIRNGTPDDIPAVLAMFDSAVAWLTAQGRTGQWGSRPFTGDPRRTQQVTTWAESGGMRIADIDATPAGCVVVGPAHDYVTPAAEPELYVQALVTDRRHAGRGVGRTLLDWAAQHARGLGVGLLRVDCYAGDDGRLVAYYESCGFTRAEPFTVGEWPGMLLHRRP